MISKYIITYEVNGESHITDWYAPSKKIVKEHFEMWHEGIKIISIEKVK